MRLSAFVAVVAAVAAVAPSRPAHAAGTPADFKIYEEQFWGGVYEKLTQNTNLFGSASQGAFSLRTNVHKGNFIQEAILKRAAGLISRRDPMSNAAAADITSVQDEHVSVKVPRKIGPYADSLAKWRLIGSTPEEMSLLLGNQVGEGITLDYVNTAVLALEAALQGQAASIGHTVAATITHAAMVDALAKMGDQAQNIVVWVMHSKPYFDLVKQSIADKIFGVANLSIYQGTAATLGRPTVVIDSPALVDAGAPNTYNTLGLTAGSIEVQESEERIIVSEMVTGNENLLMRIQGEYGFTIKIKNLRWNIATGANPTDAALGTAANWQAVLAGAKQMPGVRLVTQ